MSALFTFTSANTSILVNDKALSGVFKIETFEQTDQENITYITINRHVKGSDELINEMRCSDPAASMAGGSRFSFKLLNNSSSAGYVSETASVSSFSMMLSKEDGGIELLLQQIIVIKAPLFLYSDDARSAGMKTTEEEDLKNLIKIIKENKTKTSNKAVLPPAEVVVPDEDLVWLNAKDHEQIKDVKPRKLKKK